MKENDFQLEPNPIEIRSEEVQEIIGHTPNWIVQWGITLIFFVFTALLAVSWFIKYPDVIKANVTITTIPAPLPIVPRTSGNLVLIKKENDVVQKGEVIAYINSTTNFQHVLQLENSLKEEFHSQPDFALGDLQPYYGAFLEAAKNHELFLRNDIFDKQILQVKKQIGSYRKLKKSLTAQFQLMQKETGLAHARFKRDSILYKNNVIAQLQYEEAQALYLQQERSFENAKASITSNEIQINLLEKQAMELEVQKVDQKNKLRQGVDNTERDLLAKIAKWKETYVLTAPMNGRVAYLGFLKQGAYLEAGKPIFSVIPDSKKLFAQAELPLAGSGKVKVGQEVNIRLENFPAEQFGMIHGKIAEISALPFDSNYLVKIDLSNYLTTTYHKTLPFKQQLKGETEIITEDLRLLERVFYQFKNLLQQRP